MATIYARSVALLFGNQLLHISMKIYINIVISSNRTQKSYLLNTGYHVNLLPLIDMSEFITKTCLQC